MRGSGWKRSEGGPHHRKRKAGAGATAALLVLCPLGCATLDPSPANLGRPYSHAADEPHAAPSGAPAIADHPAAPDDPEAGKAAAAQSALSYVDGTYRSGVAPQRPAAAGPRAAGPGVDPALARASAGDSRPYLEATYAAAPAPAGAKPGAAGGNDPDVKPAAADSPATSERLLTAGAELGALPGYEQFPIDLNTSLRLTEGQNPRIAGVRSAILAALAVQAQARVLMVPTLNAGVTYVGHLGNWQRSFGQINNLSDQFMYLGGGAGIIGVAGTVPIPAVQIFSPLTDAVFEPLAARQNLGATQFDATATANQVLLEAASRYFELLRTEARLEVRREAAAQTYELVKVTANYAKTGQGRDADADRAYTEYKRRVAQAQNQEGEVAAAAALLSETLHLDPRVRLRPAFQRFDAIALVDPASALPDLLEVGLRTRPELGSRNARIAEADAHLSQEIARPFLPTLFAGFSGGSFGGGSNVMPPQFGRFGGRTDLDVMAYWTLQGFGFGNLNLQRQRRAQVGEALAERARTVNRVREEITSARAEAQAAARVVETARRGLVSAAEGYLEDIRLSLSGGVVQRHENGDQLIIPLEAINSIDLLMDIRLTYIDAVIGNNKAQFALFVALGSPPPLDQDIATATAPLPAETPTASPPTPPVTPPHHPLPDFGFDPREEEHAPH